MAAYAVSNRHNRLRGAGAGAGDPSAGGAGAGGTDAGSAGAGGTGAGGTGAGSAGAGGAGAGDPGAGGAGVGGTGAGGAGAGGAGAVSPGARGAGAGDHRAGGASAWGAGDGSAGAGGTVQRRPFFVLPQPTSLPPRDSVLRQVLSPTVETQVPIDVDSPHPWALAEMHSRAPALQTTGASPTIPRLLATVVTDPSFESIAVSALVAELVDFAAACRLDYATSLVVESEYDCPPSIRGECLAGAVPHLVAILLTPEGDPDAPDIPTPRSYVEAITGPYSSQLQIAMDAEMASWKSTGTYVDAVPPSGANILDGMWIFRPPTASLWSPSVASRVARHTEDDLAALGFAPSTADPSLFLRTDTLLPPFYVLVYVDDLVFATVDTEVLALVKSELQKRHTCTDLGTCTPRPPTPSVPLTKLLNRRGLTVAQLLLALAATKASTLRGCTSTCTTAASTSTTAAAASTTSATDFTTSTAATKAPTPGTTPTSTATLSASSTASAAAPAAPSTTLAPLALAGATSPTRGRRSSDLLSANEVNSSSRGNRGEKGDRGTPLKEGGAMVAARSIYS
ncbi:unnamed protein product [Closterium sp. NIES-53]